MRQVAQAKWNSVTANDLETPEAARQEAISDLLQYVARFGDDPEFHLDPFAAEPCYPVLFKAFNGLSNQLGLNPLNEAYTYHLLLHAIEGVIPGLGISLTPVKTMSHSERSQDPPFIFRLAGLSFDRVVGLSNSVCADLLAERHNLRQEASQLREPVRRPAPFSNSRGTTRTSPLLPCPETRWL